MTKLVVVINHRGNYENVNYMYPVQDYPVHTYTCSKPIYFHLAKQNTGRNWSYIKKH